MATDARIRALLDSASFEDLLVGELGWDYPQEYPLSPELAQFDVWPLAEKQGVVVWGCPEMPPAQEQQNLDRSLARLSAERLLVFFNPEKQLWLWPERRPSGGTRLVPHAYSVGSSHSALIQRFQRVEFKPHEEAELTLLAVRERVRAAFNAEKVTKKFYRDISAQRDKLTQAISGLEGQPRQFYASILLDRLIFIYFIQQKGFLDDDRHYLRHRLEMVRDWLGPDQFFGFYKEFLVPLFHEALGSSTRRYDDPEIKKLIGTVPYINGGLFQKIPLESSNDIQVPDAAFKEVFDLFDQYRWHLDERPRSADNEINPEVLGYILEQYINQKEQGAYYTAEDITGYMTGLTISGYFLDQVDHPSIWALAQQNPDRYIHEAMRYGSDVMVDPVEPKDWVSAEWEEISGPDIGLPTEKCRESADRIRRYRILKDRMGRGEIASVNEATTANLDLTRLAMEWLLDQKDPETLIKAWTILKGMRVLDPTCGSGAFLLAVLKVMQDLYESALTATWNLKEKGIAHPDLETILEESENQPSQEYYLRKTIALHNLYGVDIMDEAVEIARLRLFLALASTVDEKENLEPLPDLDMNIRCGNILVGCINTEDLLEKRGGDWTVKEKLQDINERAKLLRDRYRTFQKIQREKMSDEVAEFKRRLQHDMKSLAHDLDRLYADAGAQKGDWDMKSWRLSHQPFHWLAEFPEAILDGGFSVVIGNPPFIRSHKVNYQIKGFETENAPDIYAPCMERSVDLLVYQGRLALIAPISSVSGLRFATLRNVLRVSVPNRWVTAFDLIPGNLFKAKVRPVIITGCVEREIGELRTSNLRRWRTEYRPYLFQTTCFSKSAPISILKDVWPLIGDDGAESMWRELQASNVRIGNSIVKNGKYRVGRKAVMNRRFMTAFLTEPPSWKKENSEPGSRIVQTKVKWLGFNKEFHQHAAFLIFAGRFGHLLWTFVGDAFDITDSMLKSFPCDLERLSPLSNQLADLATQLDQTQRSHPLVDNNKNYIGNYDLGKCRDITDQSDQLIMAELGVGHFWPSVLMLDNRIIKSNDESAKTVHYWLKAWTPTRGPWNPSMPD